MNKQPTVFIVDDDNSVRDSLCWLIESIGLHVLAYESAIDFFQFFNQLADEHRHGCIVSDIRMQGMSGLELQTQLREQKIHLPIIFISGHGDVTMAVQAMKAGAVDFLTKPINDQTLVECIQRTLSQEIKTQSQRIQCNSTRTRLATLTPRETEVLEKIINGKLNKVIATDLNVSNKTIEAHRAKVMEKMCAHTVAELVRMVVRVEK